MSRVLVKALDRAAELIGAAFGVEVLRDPLGPADAVAESLQGTELVAALADAEPQPGEFLMGSATPYEFSCDAPFELVVVAGDEATRLERREALMLAAAAAIAADPTLGGLVDWAELAGPDPSVGARYAACAAKLSLLYSAPTALG